MSFDYSAPAELFLSKRTKIGRKNYQRFTTAAEAIRYAVEDLRTPETSASTAAKFSASMKPPTFHCASLSDAERRARSLRD
jgi:hypothetical protein